MNCSSHHYIRCAFILVASPPRPNDPSPDTVLTKKKKTSNIAQYIIFVPPCSALRTTKGRRKLSNIPDIFFYICSLHLYTVWRKKNACFSNNYNFVYFQYKKDI
jgi:hypothetical protein